MILASELRPSEVTLTVVKNFMLKIPSNDVMIDIHTGWTPTDCPIKITGAERAEYFHKPAVTQPILIPVLRSSFLLGQ